ncbi:unnamed protein product [Merluccius merluccius]
MDETSVCISECDCGEADHGEADHRKNNIVVADHSEADSSKADHGEGDCSETNIGVADRGEGDCGEADRGKADRLRPEVRGEEDLISGQWLLDKPVMFHVSHPIIAPTSTHLHHTLHIDIKSTLAKHSQIVMNLKMQDEGLTLNEKCDFTKEHIIFDGHKISAKGIEPDPN